MRTACSFVLLAFSLFGLGQTPGSVPMAPAGSSFEWRRTRAEDVGMDARVLAALDRDFKAGKYRFVDGMFVTRRGGIVAEAAYRHDYRKVYGGRDPVSHMYNYYDVAWHPFYKGTGLHTLQSVTKTVTSIVIGVARRRGDFPSIDTLALSVLPNRTVAHLDDRKRRMTVRHLLTMTAGIDWDESKTEYTDPRNNCAVMERSRDWVQYVVDRPMAAEPGTTFVYNSGATVLLAEIFREATSKDIADYADAHLFTPLGITRHYWKRTPLGLPDTEGGLYLTQADLARLGYLFLMRGKWEGQQLVSSDWVDESVRPAVTAGASWRYGYAWWLVPYGSGSQRWAWVMNGYGGQRAIVLPDLQIVATFTGWNIDENEPLPIQPMVDRLVAAVRDVQ